MEYLEFEKPIQELMEQYNTCSLVGEDAGVDVKNACAQIEDKIIEKKKEIYGSLTPWQRVQLSRHPDRPYTLDFIKGIVDKDSFLELHGDRNFADDPAMILPAPVLSRAVEIGIIPANKKIVTQSMLA